MSRYELDSSCWFVILFFVKKSSYQLIYLSRFFVIILKVSIISETCPVGSTQNERTQSASVDQQLKTHII